MSRKKTEEPENHKKFGHWICPIHGEVDTVKIRYSETVYGDATYDGLDEDLVDELSHEAYDSDDYDRDGPYCDECNNGTKVEWITYEFSPVKPELIKSKVNINMKTITLRI